MEEKTISRQSAVKTVIRELLQAEFHQETESKPNFITLNSGEIVFRVNVLGIVLRKEKQGNITNLLVDDGTGNMVVRLFEENKKINEIEIGAVILILGKLRIYAEEKYLSPEIIKKINPLWLKVRALEFSDFFSPLATRTFSPPPLPEKVEFKTAEEFEEEVISAEAPLFSTMNLSTEKILQLIKELDRGEGASMEELIEKSALEGVEDFLKRMLERGEIFQVVPGKIKIL